ncbi:olfactory receptor 11G2-like [Petaurus breviceps papuanus]|uniref:olfactory receptor 11G2-like n=1 Tax=Petaurus breviceps papuanus TaxID=3040969 RepID=UPI0036DA4F1E
MSTVYRQVTLSNTYNSSKSITGFILLGFTYTGETQKLLFMLLLTIYILTLLGNGSIICAVCWDKRIHTPMYILLANFSLLEICYVTTTVPNMLAYFFSETKVISLSGCLLQFYFFSSFGAAECLFLAIMAFDRYLAICRPLHYHIIMTKHLRNRLVVNCWVIGFLWYPVPAIIISQLSFCGPKIIDHIVCDPSPILVLTCTPAPKIEFTCSLLSSMILVVPFIFIIGTYTLVLKAVLRIPSGRGKRKAFSTCGSHIVVVSLFYGSAMVIYMRPRSGNEAETQKIVTLFYTMVTPFLNPLIYSLRNKEMKAALKKVLGHENESLCKRYPLSSS